MKTDGQLQQEVIANLELQRPVIAPGIGVEVKDGIMTLAGVTGVSDQIAVKLKLFVSSVKVGIEAALKRSASADANKISVDIKGAEVMPTGNAHSWNESAKPQPHLHGARGACAASSSK